MSEFPRAPSAGNVVASTSEQGRGGEVVSEPVPGVPARHGPANLTRALSVITAALGDAGGLAGPASRLTTGATARQDSSAGMAGACPPASYPPIGDYAPLSDGHSAALVCPGTGRSTGAASTASTPARCSPASSTGTATATSAWHRSAPTPWPGATGPARMCSRPASARGGRGRGGRLHGDPPRRIRRRRHQLPPPAAPPRARRGRLCEDAVGVRPPFDYGLTIPRLEMRGDDIGVVYGGADALVLQSELPLTQVEVCGCGGERSWPPARSLPCAHLLAAPPAGSPPDGPRRDAGTHRGDLSVLDGLVERLHLRRPVPRRGCCAAPSSSRPSPTLHRCHLRRSDHVVAGGARVACATGTTATRGCATPPSTSIHCSAWATPRRPTPSWPGSSEPRRGGLRDLQIMYGVGGERLLPEIELAALDGYRSSSPMRIGNAAAEQSTRRLRLPPRHRLALPPRRRGDHRFLLGPAHRGGEGRRRPPAAPR